MKITLVLIPPPNQRAQNGNKCTVTVLARRHLADATREAQYPWRCSDSTRITNQYSTEKTKKQGGDTTGQDSTVHEVQYGKVQTVSMVRLFIIIISAVHSTVRAAQYTVRYGQHSTQCSTGSAVHSAVRALGQRSTIHAAHTPLQA